MLIVRILLALLVISVVITFHEFGHFLLAKANGVEVVEFSLGMGPRVLSHQGKKTRYSVKLLPIGGSCLMKGEDETSDEEGTFNSKGVWPRISIIFAGPFFNFILAFILSVIIISFAGIDKCYVLSVDEDSKAAESGLEAGDLITEFDGHSIGVGRELYLYESLDGVTEELITVTYERDGKEYTVTFDTTEDKRYFLGVRYSASEDDPEPAELTDIIDDSAAEAAGLKTGDVITAVNGTEIASGAELNAYLSEHPLDGSDVTLTYTRKNKEYTITLTPQYTSLYDYGFSYNASYYREEVSFGQTLKYGLLEVKYWIKATGKSLVYMLRGKASTEDIGGPVRVVSEMSNVMEESYTTDGLLYAFLNLLNWAILLSANLGVMNLLPIPALDGGRLLFLIVEAVTGKKIPPEKEGIIHLIGFVLLMVLMVFIFFNDIKNVFF